MFIKTRSWARQMVWKPHQKCLSRQKNKGNQVMCFTCWILHKMLYCAPKRMVHHGVCSGTASRSPSHSSVARFLGARKPSKVEAAKVSCVSSDLEPFLCCLLRCQLAGSWQNSWHAEHYTTDQESGWKVFTETLETQGHAFEEPTKRYLSLTS